MRIISNNQPRALIYGYELSDSERADFDYIAPDEIESHEFFRYRGDVYDIGEFMRADLPPWDGISCDTYFSGVLIRYCDDNEAIVVARFYS